MTEINIIKNLITAYNYKISTYKNGIWRLYNVSKIQLSEKISESLFTSIINSIIDKFGAPVYIHSYYGFTWDAGGKYISCNIIEEIYGSDFIDIFLFDKMPRGKKLPYKEYAFIDETIKQVFNDLGFNYNISVNYNRNGFSYIAVNEKTEWLLRLSGKNMTCYFSDVCKLSPEKNKTTPRYRCKKRVNLKNLETIKKAMEQSFFENTQESIV